MISLEIDGQKVTVKEGTTILNAARKIGVDIPTLCYLKDLNVEGACRVCLVEVEGDPRLAASCVYKVREGMKVKTTTPRVIKARKQMIELLLSDHPFECLTCIANQNCELQTLAKRYDIRGLKFRGERRTIPIDDLSPSIVRDPSKCILCRRCITVCKKVITAGIYDINERGFKSFAGPAMNDSQIDTPCTYCGQCILVCPTGALSEQRKDTELVWEALADSEKHVVIQTAPSIRATIGEMFGMPIGSLVTGKVVAALKRMGFDKVFDDCFGADVVVMEEGAEFMHRLKEGQRLPQFTSCCPGWVKFAENYYHEILPHLSTVRSPQQVFGALSKTYYAEKAGIDPKKIFCVSVMPCVAKKFEARRPEMEVGGVQAVDAVLTTRELGQIIKQAGLDLSKLPDEKYDEPMGYASGAGVIFGAGGGVMEATLRTVYEKLTGEKMKAIQYEAIRSDSYRELEVEINGEVFRFAVVRGLGNARHLLDRVLKGEVKYHLVEIMACPGGCVSGGGQPIYSHKDQWYLQVDAGNHRGNALFREDESKEIRTAHENPWIQKLYKDYLGEPMGERSLELFHTTYTKRPMYGKEKHELT
ncbi:MAG: [FeFe] hydrogenase, group A [Halanaerobiales bacterium]|nr:[FeFe] hydrogenase, group A [Halanaerobiales bacterium]